MRSFFLVMMLFLFAFFGMDVWAGDRNQTTGKTNHYSFSDPAFVPAKSGLLDSDWSFMTPDEREREYDRLERYGFIAPSKDNTFAEFGQGIAYAILSVLRDEDKMRRNQHLRPYPNYELASLDPVDIARTVGSGLGYLLAIGIPVLILVSPILIFRWINNRKRREEAETIRSIQNELKQVQAKKEEQHKNDQALLSAMNELETGNLDKLTWAKALIAADGDEKRAKIEYLKLRGQ